MASELSAEDTISGVVLHKDLVHLLVWKGRWVIRISDIQMGFLKTPLKTSLGIVHHLDILQGTPNHEAHRVPYRFYFSLKLTLNKRRFLFSCQKANSNLTCFSLPSHSPVSIESYYT